MAYPAVYLIMGQLPAQHLSKTVEVEHNDNAMSLQSKQWKDLLHEHSHFILRTLRKLTNNLQDAEDLYQNVLLAIWKKQNQLPEKKELLKSWIYQCLRFELLNFYRKEGRRKRFIDKFKWSVPSNSPTKIPFSKRSKVLQSLDILPIEQREVFVLVVFEDYRSNEIAQLLELSENTVRSRLKLAKKKIKKFLEINTEEPTKKAVIA